MELIHTCYRITDPDRSVAFYEALGFEKRSVVAFGDGHRWIELYPPSGTTGIALAPGEGAAGVQTGIILATDDIDATHADLRSSGLDVDPEVARPGAPAKIRLRAAEVVGPVPPMGIGNSSGLYHPDIGCGSGTLTVSGDHRNS